MKKKITYILSLLMIVCMLGACGSDNAEKTYGGYTTDELHTEATDSLSNIQNYIALVDSCGGYDSYEKSVKKVEVAWISPPCWSSWRSWTATFCCAS